MYRGKETLQNGYSVYTCAVVRKGFAAVFYFMPFLFCNSASITQLTLQLQYCLSSAQWGKMHRNGLVVVSTDVEFPI